jgi:hypothetical protein
VRQLVAGLVLGGLLLWAPDPGAAPAQDVFAFVPPGGKTILAGVLRANPPVEEVRALLLARRTQREWLAHLAARRGAVPALQGLKERESRTLAAYLAVNTPLPPERLARDVLRTDWAKALPPDGRDLVLGKCQFCHIITVSVTQGKDAAGWRGLLGTPNHAGIAMSEAEKATLAAYLEIITPIPIEDVPEELRAGGASY